MNEILNAITTVGFPIVMCILMGVFVKYLMDKNNSQVSSIIDIFSEELQKLNATLTENTRVLSILAERINNEDIQ